MHTSTRGSCRVLLKAGERELLFELLARALAELVGDAIMAAIPERAFTAIVTVILGFAGAFFVGCALFVLHAAIVAANPVLLGLVLVSGLLSAYCFTLMMKGVREVRVLSR